MRGGIERWQRCSDGDVDTCHFLTVVDFLTKSVKSIIYYSIIVIWQNESKVLYSIELLNYCVIVIEVNVEV